MPKLILIFQKELRILYRCSSIPFLGGIFLLLLSLMMSFLDLEVSSNIFAGLLWIATTLSLLLCSQGIFVEDIKEGIILPIFLNRIPLEIFVLSKIMAVWIGICLPIVLISACLLFVFSMDFEFAIYVFLSMLAGTIALSAFACLGSILTLSLKNATVLLPLLIIPLYVPILALGTMIIEALSLDLPFGVYMQLLFIISITSLVVIPFVGGLIIKESL